MRAGDDEIQITLSDGTVRTIPLRVTPASPQTLMMTKLSEKATPDQRIPLSVSVHDRWNNLVTDDVKLTAMTV